MNRRIGGWLLACRATGLVVEIVEFFGGVSLTQREALLPTACKGTLVANLGAHGSFASKLPTLALAPKNSAWTNSMHEATWMLGAGPIATPT